MRRRIMRPVVDLPQPDSPTRPSVSPGITSNETPSTARTTPAGLPNTPFLIGKVLGEVADGEQRLDGSDGCDGVARRCGAVMRRAATTSGSCVSRAALRARRRDGSATRGRRRSDRAADARSRSAPTRTGSDRGSGSRSATPSAAARCRESSRAARARGRPAASRSSSPSVYG